MDKLIKKIAYLKGLSEGYEIDTQNKEGKLLLEIINILEEMADEFKKTSAELENYVDIIESDLSELEDHVYDEFDGYDDYDDIYDDYDELDDEQFNEDNTCESCESCSNQE